MLLYVFCVLVAMIVCVLLNVRVVLLWFLTLSCMLCFFVLLRVSMFCLYVLCDVLWFVLFLFVFVSWILCLFETHVWLLCL